MIAWLRARAEADRRSFSAQVVWLLQQAQREEKA
jgi:hypothetical protein